MKSTITLQTKRLILRPIAIRDRYEIYYLRTDSDINRFVERPATNTIEDAEDFVRKVRDGTTNNEHVYWGIQLIETPTLIGTICLWNYSADRKTAEIGFELHPEFQGKGLMNEAVKSVISYGFDDVNLEEIYAVTHKNNRNAILLLEAHAFLLQEAQGNKTELKYRRTKSHD